MIKHIALSVAHSAYDQGAQTAHGLSEYKVSQRATRVCFDALKSADIPCVMLETGRFTQTEYVVRKKEFCRGSQLGVEMHFNASSNKATNYAEVIYFPGSAQGARAAADISSALLQGFNLGNHGRWPVRTPRADGALFFLKAPAPSVIVEGVFGSNAEQAAFLESSNGPEVYGLLVAEGLKKWWVKFS